MSTPKNGMNRRVFLAAIPALAGVGLLGPRPLTAQDVEESFIGGVLTHPHLLTQYRQLRASAFDDGRLKVLWTLMKHVAVSGADVRYLWLWVIMASRKGLWSRIGGERFLERLSDRAAPAECLPDLARRLALVAPPYHLGKSDLKAAGIRPEDLRPVVTGRRGLGRTGFGPRPLV